jgi:hypothetical protein
MAGDQRGLAALDDSERALALCPNGIERAYLRRRLDDARAAGAAPGR